MDELLLVTAAPSSCSSDYASDTGLFGSPLMLLVLDQRCYEPYSPEMTVIVTIPTRKKSLTPIHTGKSLIQGHNGYLFHYSCPWIRLFPVIHGAELLS